MLVDWKTLAPESKVWVFAQADLLTAEQQTALKRELETFIQNWVSHQTALKAAYQIIDAQFIVLAAEAPSGCSTDTLFRTMTKLSKNYALKPVPNRYVAYRDQTDQIKFIDFPDLKAIIQAKKLLPDHTVFDNTINDLATFERAWQQKATASWLKRYF